MPGSKDFQPQHTVTSVAADVAEEPLSHKVSEKSFDKVLHGSDMSLPSKSLPLKDEGAQISTDEDTNDDVAIVVHRQTD